ncbi:MAG: hypothetical protein RL728_264 [Bacteroidota bacterium]|jgi:hypothetical protein
MRYTFLILFCFIFSLSYGQRKRRKDMMGGARDYRPLSNTGLQVSVGPTYTYGKSKNIDIDSRTTFNIIPEGRLGFYGDIGTAYFTPSDRKGIWGRLVKYTDWGIGAALFGGKESLSYLNKTTNVTTFFGNGKFYQYSLVGRLTFHHMFYIPKTGVFMDNGLGFNVNYTGLNFSSYSLKDEELQKAGIKQVFADRLMGQLHYNVGFGFRLKRGSYCIPSVQLPIVGIYEWNQGSPRFNWFSSQYLPVIFKVKFVRLFTKHTGGCDSFGTDEDRKRNEEYMQNK